MLVVQFMMYINVNKLGCARVAARAALVHSFGPLQHVPVASAISATNLSVLNVVVNVSVDCIGALAFSRLPLCCITVDVTLRPVVVAVAVASSCLLLL